MSGVTVSLHGIIEKIKNNIPKPIMGKRYWNMTSLRVDQRFSKCDPWTISITSKLVRNAHPDTESDPPGMELSNLF